MTASATTVDHDFTWRGLRLAGSLHRPGGRGPHPTVVMAQGSGPADRTSGGYFDRIRPAFGQRGLATFSFDKPGCGRSEGDWHDHGLYDRADQVLAALQSVAEHDDVDADNLGLWGHSQGAWLAHIVAARSQRLRFVVAASGPTMPVSAQDIHACEHTMRATGYSESEIADALDHIAALHRAARDRVDFAHVTESILEPASAEPWRSAYLSIDAESDGPQDWKLTQILINEPHEPRAELRKATVPFLAVFGGLDPLLPAWRCAKDVGEALAEAPTDDVTVVVFPGADHRLQIPGGEELTPGYLALLGDWCAARIVPGQANR